MKDALNRPFSVLGNLISRDPFSGYCPLLQFMLDLKNKIVLRSGNNAAEYAIAYYYSLSDSITVRAQSSFNLTQFQLCRGSIYDTF